PPPSSPPFPYTTLFRSSPAGRSTASPRNRASRRSGGTRAAPPARRLSSNDLLFGADEVDEHFVQSRAGDVEAAQRETLLGAGLEDRKSTRLNSSHVKIS